MSCKGCGGKVKPSGRLYCSNKCQLDHQYHLYILKWQAGLVSGNTGIRARSVSGHVERWLHERFGAACQTCGWAKVNHITGKVPLEIDHIDGNAENSSPTNLRLICPNCHALTSNFRNLNRGNGRGWRRQKYLKN